MWRAGARPLLLPALAVFLTLGAAPALRARAGDAQTSTPFTPSFWDPGSKLEKPDLSGLRQIRFLTEDDFPPFNFALADGQLAGFNIDLARAICDELAVPCTIQRRRWDLLIPSLEDGGGDAVIASLAMNAATRAKVDFTEPYFETPGRFAMRVDTTLKAATPEVIQDRPVAVVAGSAHEAFLKARFPQATATPFETSALARNALKTGRVQAVFGDAVSLSFWLNGADADGCCAFKDGPYADPHYFGDGMGVAVRKGAAPLRRALNYALARLAQRGVFSELYLKYFPVGPF
jgi:polar amino acid transport system substrate-binding protein